MGESLLLKSGTTETAGQTLGSASVNQPDLDPKTLRAGVRAISSVDQIYALCEGMFDPQSDRNKKNGIIADQYNDSPPYPPEYLKNKGQKFRHNASTGFLSGILDQAVGAPIDVVDQAQYLTSASLDAKDDPQGTKTQAYRQKFTRLVRSWSGWDSHTSALAQEDVAYGYAAVVCDDPDEWRPEICRQDQFGVPDNTGQHASEAQFFARKKSFLIHKLVEKIVEREAAEAAGWDIDKCVEALNEAMPQDRGEQGEQAAGPRTYADLIRDGNAGAAHDPSARTVDVYILLAVEADGKVSKFIVTQSQRRLLYESYDEFEKMEDIAAFYSLNPGTGTLYSSKGGGRKLINLAKSAERTRNKAMDHTYLAGLVWMWSSKGMVGVQMKVFDQFAVIGSEATIADKALPDRSEVYDKADERVTRYAEQAFGAYIPRKIGEGDQREKTAREVMEEASRENIVRASWLKRFFKQFGQEMGLIAKKAGDSETKDPEAKAWQEDMEKEDGITPDLLKKLVSQPQGMVMDDLTKTRTAALIQASPQMLASPFFDKYAVQYELSLRVLGKELTDRLMFKNGIDPNSEAANIRMQELENTSIRSGGSPNAVPTDHHPTHLKLLVGHLDNDEPKLEKSVADGSILQTPQVLDNWQTAIKHGDAHTQMLEGQAGQSNNQDELALANKFKGRLAQSQQKLDASLKALQEKQKAAAAQPKQPPPQAQPQPPTEKTYGGMSEKIFVAWIGHFQLLPQGARDRLLAMSDLPSSGEAPKPNGVNRAAALAPNGNESLTTTASHVTQPV